MANYQYCNFPVECADYFCNSVTYLYKEQTEKENYVGVIVTVNYLPPVSYTHLTLPTICSV